MRAGRRRTRVIVDAPTEIQDPTNGEELEGWRYTGSFLADVQPIAGREATRDSQLLAEMDTRITTLWSSFVDTITAKHRLRVRFRGREMIYNIAAPPIEVDLHKREVQFLCKSGVNVG
jgi:head-tail adaptor